MSLFRPVYVSERTKPDGFRHEVRPRHWWSLSDRRKAKLSVFVLDQLRHPAAREALEESGNRVERRRAKGAPSQLDRKRGRQG